MIRPSTLTKCCVAASVFGLALVAEPNSARWNDGSYFLQSAFAQMPVAGCTTALIPGRVDGAQYYKCDNGEYYRDIGGDNVKVDLNGEPIPEAEVSTPEPPSGATTAPELPAAKPHFQTAPTN